MDRALIFQGNSQYLSGMTAADHLLDLATRPTAIFASNDAMAAGAIAASQNAGLSVPTDISIAGFGDCVLATVIWPNLSTVRLPASEMACAAIRALVGYLRSGQADRPEPQTIGCELMLRDTIGPVPGQV